jgi:hypothetical protein
MSKTPTRPKPANVISVEKIAKPKVKTEADRRLLAEATCKYLSRHAHYTIAQLEDAFSVTLSPSQIREALARRE